MSIPRIKTWIAGEVLTAAALNTEISNLSDKVGDLAAATTVTGVWTFNPAVAIGSGGTGATTAAAARSNLGAVGTADAAVVTGSWDFDNLVQFLKNVEFQQKVFWDAVQTLTDGANIAWNLETSNFAKVTLGGNRTLDNPTNKSIGVWELEVAQDVTGSRTLAYGTDYKFGDLGAPTLSTGANKRDFLNFYCDGTNMIFRGALTGY